jgi:hypothetical protein
MNFCVVELSAAGEGDGGRQGEEEEEEACHAEGAEDFRQSCRRNEEFMHTGLVSFGYTGLVLST